MCNLAGLFCFEKAKEEKRKEMLNLAKKLLLENQSFNKDATGMALIDTYRNKVFVLKEGTDATEFVAKLPDKLSKKSFNLILLHNRNATTGSANDNKNNHPFATKKSVLIHNGNIIGYEEMIKRHKLKPKSKCDSEVIQLIYDKKDNIKKTIKTFEDSLTLNFALYDRKKNSLYLYRDNRLAFSKLPNKNLFIFSSENNISNLFTNANKKEIFMQNNETINPETDVSNNLLYTINFNNSLIFKNKCNLKSSNYNIVIHPSNWNSYKSDKEEEEKELKKFDDYLEQQNNLHRQNSLSGYGGYLEEK